MAFQVFQRTWWKENADWPNGLEPEAGKRRRIGKPFATIDEARAECREWNATHKPGRYSRKAEIEEIGGRGP